MKTILKITAMDFTDGNLMLGCAEGNENTVDAICSFLGKEVVVEHEGRVLKGVSFNKDMETKE